MLFVIVFISSCKKEGTYSKETPSINNNSLMRAGDDIVENKIVKFFLRMKYVRENPNNVECKEWNYTTDSTVWYIEAALNYKYAYKWQYEGEEIHSDLYNIDSSFLVINSNNSDGVFNIVKLQQTFDIFALELEKLYQNTNADSKFFVLNDIMVKGLTSSNDLKLMQFMVIGKANQILPQNGWIWGLNMGDCSGGNQGIDATDIIMNKLSQQRSQLQRPTGHWGFVSVDPILNGQNGWIYPFDVPIANGVTNPTPFANYLLFYTDKGANDPHPCISNSNLDWYVNNILSIEALNKPLNEEISYTEITSTVSSSMQTYGLIHEIRPRYGELVFYKYIIPID